MSGVVAEQIPAVRHRSAHPDARYELGCLYIGVNDVLSPGWDATRFESGFRQALTYVATRCDLVLVLTVPLDLGRPRAGRKVIECNAAIERVAADVGVRVTDLRDFRGRNLVMADHVHPTAFGQIAIAERVLATLAADGITARVMPAELIRYGVTRWGRLRGGWTYGYRRVKISARHGAKLAFSRIPRG